MMADAKECDICKKLYKLTGDVRYSNIHLMIDTRIIDLCPSCQLELKKWYESRKEKSEK